MGEPARKLDDLIAATADASTRIRAVRDDARLSATQVIRLIEMRVIESLHGDTIRGLSNLVAGSEPPCFAAQLQPRRYGIDHALPPDGREALTMNRRGEFVVLARYPGSLAWSSRPAEDEDLRAEDLEPIVRAVQTAIERHLTRTAKRTASYASIAALSERLVGAVGFRL